MKAIILIFFSGFSMLSIASTLLDQSFWPIAPYNMFNFYLDVRSPVLELILRTPNKRECRLKASETLPFEFFRVHAMFREGIAGKDFLSALLKGLKNAKWHGFDEVHTPPPCLRGLTGDSHIELVVE